MTFKLVYSIIIVSCCSLLGFIYANRYVERSRLLNNLLSTIQMIETEIVYGSTPIPILLEKIGKKSKKEIGNIFLLVKDSLEENSGDTFEHVWEKIVKSQIGNTSFENDDIDILISLGKNLGVSNSDDQKKHIRLVQEEVRRNYENSILEEGKNVKLFKNLGFLLGLSIVIILY